MRRFAIVILAAVLVAPRAMAQDESSSDGDPKADDAAQNQALTDLATFFTQTKIGVNFDGYYEFNANDPIGRVNLLRAYDVTSNSFSVNQAGIVIDHAPDAEHGRRVGLRLDLMYGQATDTLQGGAQNEPRPQIYRPLFQAYGSYVFKVGSGLQLDFGKFASALGFENNYTKDQINYSRSYFFDFLPFYHMGFRTTYDVSDRVRLTYWLVNGAQQTEDFNGFKSQAAIVTLKPAATVSWNVNYYTGKEARDLVPALNPVAPSLPTQPGLSVEPVVDPDQSRTHIFDTYASWSVRPDVTVAGEADYVALRGQSASTRLSGAAGYIEYRPVAIFRLGARTAYMADHDGLFSGISQNLHDLTATATWLPDSQFMVRAEFRRDSSDQPFFLTDDVSRRAMTQRTVTLGLIWTLGNKQGAW